MNLTPCDSLPGLTQVFIIDDEPDHLLLMRSILSRTSDHDIDSEPFLVQCFNDPRRALAALPEGGPVAIVCDFSKYSRTGTDCLREMIEREIGPVLILTGRGDEESAAAAFKAGATDYLIKFQVMENPDLLRRAIRDAVRRYTLEEKSDSLSHRLKQSNAVLERKHADLRQLSYSVSHDLQTPLASLSGSVDTLKQHLSSHIDAETVKWLNRIDASVGHMVDMLDALMVFAKAGNETIQCTEVDFGRILQSVVDEFGTMASSKNVEITFDAVEVSVVAEPHALYRVLCNVIGNAIKYIDGEAGGRVIISVSQPNDSKVRISISDNGPGIAQTQLSRVFQPFVRATAKKTGSGLGLSIAKQYVDAFGGDIKIESDGVTGTTVVMELRAASVPIEKAVAA